jgi:hypothetical protein
MGSEAPDGYATVIITPSLPGKSVKSFDRIDVTLASSGSVLAASFEPSATDTEHTNKLFRASNFDCAIDRLADRNPAYGACDIICGHRLEKNGRHSNSLAVVSKISQFRNEFEKLCRMDDGIGNRRAFNQIFLRDFSPEISTLQQAFSPHYRECHEMFDARGSSIAQEVPRGCFEKVQHGRVFPRWCMRYVSNYGNTFQNFSEPLAGECVYTGIWRCGNCVMPMLAQLHNELWPDQSTAADHYDCHDGLQIYPSYSLRQSTRPFCDMTSGLCAKAPESASCEKCTAVSQIECCLVYLARLST